MISKEIHCFLSKCNIRNLELFIEQCEELKTLLIEENSKHNLTRIVSEIDYWNKHIADSVSMGMFFKEIYTKNLTIADIGCGGGFPSIALAIAYPNLKIYAIDSIGKKTAFVSLIKEKLNLINLNTITVRANELKGIESLDIITARAVGTPDKIFKETKHLLNEKTSYILYQTPKIKEELPSLNKLKCKYILNWKCSEEFNIPGGESRVFLYACKKVL